jgi:1-acyl-sn-glycerol-3-phosphate acyltransferase
MSPAPPADAAAAHDGIRRGAATILKLLFFVIVVRPIVLVVLGLNVRRRHLLPENGPAVIVANHNSHLDTLTLMSLMPLRLLPKLRPVAAADYFLTSAAMRFVAIDLVGIVPVVRGGERGSDPLLPCKEALGRGEILILFPEGTRGEAERLSSFKRGVAHLASAFPEVPVVPVFTRGLGKALPKGSWLLVPFFCDIFVGEAFRWTGSIDGFMATLEGRIAGLAAEGHFPPWT